jgi:hypothetical protein
VSPISDPVASAGAIAHADWLELTALEAADRNSSFQDLVAALSRSGSVDGLPASSVASDRGSEVTQRLADNAFAELYNRVEACDQAYPFNLLDQYIELKDTSQEHSSYVFMLLLKHVGVTKGPRRVKGASHFEELSAEAARRYLGGDANGAESYHIGFPRRLTAASFVEALNELLRRLDDGGEVRIRPSVRWRKDGKLDLVAWRHFPDHRPGKLIAFGQCAAGADYNDKITELIPRRFLHLWMTREIVPDPLNFFFIPRCIDEEALEDVISAQAFLFDRCRIAALLEGADNNLNGELHDRTAIWNNFTLSKIRGRP